MINFLFFTVTIVLSKITMLVNTQLLNGAVAKHIRKECETFSTNEKKTFLYTNIDLNNKVN